MTENICPDDSLARGEWLFRQPAEFVKGVVRVADLPPSVAPEIALAGRSNVGKSSLINALTQRKSLARTSNAPGRTRELNFFAVGGGALMLVDLPGYGYAKAPKNQVAGWHRLIADYLKGRAGLARVILLIDARHGIKDNDRATMALLDQSAQSYQAVLTKADKPKRTELAATIAMTAEELAQHPAAHPELIVTSAETGEGLPGLRVALAGLAL